MLLAGTKILPSITKEKKLKSNDANQCNVSVFKFIYFAFFLNDFAVLK